MIQKEICYHLPIKYLAEKKVSLRIANRYAQSLFELASNSNKIAEVIKSLQCVLQALNQSEKASKFIFSQYANIDLKLPLVEGLIKSCEADQLAANFIRVLIKNNRTGYLPQIVEQLNKMQNAASSIAVVKVVLAKAPSPERMRKIESLLQAELSKKVKTNVIIDKSIIGGVKFQTEGLTYDASVKNTLNKMQKYI